MSEFASPRVLENPAVEPQITGQQIDLILEDFRSWLQQSATAGTLADSSAGADDATVDLHLLASHFIALRHEINLQTKAARLQQEQHAQTIEKLTQSLEAVQQLQKRNRELETREQDDQLRPLVKSVLDAYDSLALARREVERLSGETQPQPPLSSAVHLPFWARWLGLRKRFEQLAEQHRDALAQKQAADERMQRLLESILTGYTMSLQRLERTLAALELQPLDAVGEIFDPEKMEVVEVLTTNDRRNMEVVDVVRRGYLWRGRIFRFAQVRVAKNS